MTTAKCLALLSAAVALLHPAAALYSSSDDVLHLDEKSFEKQVLKSPGLFLVEFYAPWCGHCKNLAPAWKAAAKALKGVVGIVAVDADAHRDLAGKYGIKGFPTIKFFGENKGAPTDYNGGREPKDIVNWALGQASTIVKARMGGKAEKGGKGSSGSGSAGGNKASGNTPGGGKNVVTLDASNFDSLVLGSAQPWMVEFYAPWCGHCKSLAPEWASAAEQTKDDGVRFGAVDADAHRDLAQRFGIKGFPTIKTFAAGASSDRDAKDYNGGRTASDIVLAAQALAAAAGSAPQPVAQLTSQAQFDEACGGKRVCVLAVLPHILDDGAEKRTARLAALSEAAAKQRGARARFLWTEVGAQPALETALATGLVPAVFALSVDKKVFTAYKGPFEATQIASFCTGLSAGRPAPLPFPASVNLKAAVTAATAWDGKDAAPPAADDADSFSLDDLKDL